MAEDTEAERTLWRGDPALIYEAGRLKVVVLPQRGGKLASIVHAGREWLTQPLRPLLPISSLPALLVEGDMFGWDECAPTIDACVVQGRHLPVHGDVWSQAWVDEGAGWLEARGVHFDFRLRRRLSIRPDEFRLDYSVSANEPMPFLWAAHPQFAAGPETEVIFGTDSRNLIDLFEWGYWRDKPEVGQVYLKDVPQGRSAKLFVDPEAPTDKVGLRHPDGATMELRWDPDLAPYLGVWMDRAGIGPVDAIALEPMTGYADSCEAAARADRVLWLVPGRPLDWSLSVVFL